MTMAIGRANTHNLERHVAARPAKITEAPMTPSQWSPVKFRTSFSTKLNGHDSQNESEHARLQ
jgi:hypothetical protein